MKKKLFIFSNESISSQDGKFFCDNIDLKTTPEGLNKEFEVKLRYITIFFLIFFPLSRLQK